jgi:serine/threonine-protein kinase RsbT
MGRVKGLVGRELSIALSGNLQTANHGRLGKSTYRISARDEAGVYAAAQRAKRLAHELDFDEVSQTRLGTVALELARNALIHGGGGEIVLRCLSDQDRIGLEIEVMDYGPGIQDLDQALTDGYSTAGGLGTGLGAARRLSDEFEIESQPGSGTRVIARSWHHGRSDRTGRKGFSKRMA